MSNMPVPLRSPEAGDTNKANKVCRKRTPKDDKRSLKESPEEGLFILKPFQVTSSAGVWGLLGLQGFAWLTGPEQILMESDSAIDDTTACAGRQLDDKGEGRAIEHHGGAKRAEGVLFMSA